MDVLKKIPHRHFVFSIPKILRRYFLYDRKLLADLSRYAWESLKVFIQDAGFLKTIPSPAPSSLSRPSATFSDLIPAATSYRVKLSKDELISQKSGRQSIFLTQPHRQSLLFDAKQMKNVPEKCSLTSKNSPPILPLRKRKFLSLKILFPEPLHMIDIC